MTIQAVLKQCFQSASSNKQYKTKQNNRMSRESYSLLSTHPYGYLTSSSFFASFFVENSTQADVMAHA